MEDYWRDFKNFLFCKLKWKLTCLAHNDWNNSRIEEDVGILGWVLSNCLSYFAKQLIRCRVCDRINYECLFSIVLMILSACFSPLTHDVIIILTRINAPTHESHRLPQ